MILVQHQRMSSILVNHQDFYSGFCCGKRDNVSGSKIKIQHYDWSTSLVLVVSKRAELASRGKKTLGENRGEIDGKILRDHRH